MGSTSRVLGLISTTPVLLRPLRRPSSLRRLLIKCSSQPQPQPQPHSVAPQPRKPLPEWWGFLEQVSPSTHSNATDSHVFVAPTELPQAFLLNAHSCFSFARLHPSLLWSLPRKDVQVVVENVSPALFKDALSVATRMQSFLAGTVSPALESEKPSTFDLMKYLLSYVHVATGSSRDLPISGRVESSVRRLFEELVKASRSSSDSVVSMKKQFPGYFEQAPRSLGKNFEMKRGDWICQKCSFMNFAKNPKCLRCEETRPKSLVTGGEWECPQCEFFNFSRNAVCLRCDCKKPQINTPHTSSTFTGLGANVSSSQHDSEGRLTGTDRQQQQWLTKIIQLESTDLSSASPEKDLPASMNPRDTSFIARASNFGIGGNPDGVNLKPHAAENNRNADITQSLNEFLAEKSPSTSTSVNSNDLSKNSGDGSLSALSDSALVEEQLSSEKLVSSTRDEEKEEFESSERWFKRVAEVHDVKERPNSTSDEDFPKSMPMRTGENRFVVSKKKDRSLTSPMYKRRMAVEQTGDSNYVPFVPFPPGYFSKDKQDCGSDSTGTSSLSVAPANDRTALNDIGTVPSAHQQTDAMSSIEGVGDQNDERSAKFSEASDNTGQPLKDVDSWSYGRADTYGASSQSCQNLGVTDSWRGSSLEGSAVKEPDTLDMSEEAKTERWFRRVAQIKDISELSQIPDEDFPSIMPMRKGVNRFVVSKRKTTLERRLTSSQYRKNNPPGLNSESDRVRKGN